MHYRIPATTIEAALRPLGWRGRGMQPAAAMRATGWLRALRCSLAAARAVWCAVLVCGLLLASLVWAQPALAAEPAQLRIGYQKAVSSLVLAKQHRLLEQRFPQTKITWVEFPAGPQLLEALNVGSIDLGGAGDIPPLFAQAAGADLLYVGWVPPTPKAETILVPSTSAVRTVADLKGKRVAFQKGSSAHNLLLRLLAKSGLSMRDITPLYLSPANARAAFAAGQVDAWAIWDPWYSALTLDGSARLLANGEGLGLTGGFFLSSRRYATAWGPFVQQVMGTLNQADGLLERDRAGSIKILAQVSGLSPAVVERTLTHRPPASVQPLSAQVIKAQQATADLFYAQRLLPKRVLVAPAVWRAPAATAARQAGK
ncbi:sulfonate ABC transporter substrate-binding protein [Xanthomonas vasicola]|uniref:sulfonate ABC transporter substrate-binding protein n=1 Tax=Xanthomonas vasicola TaxID=56459 RepID=UPI000531FEF5|nr:sulfonate ABC transporter substrate-binding protein [Xanthomonas vasicola]AZR23757.1 sulfonate ABC transporter substrate-binding protein [Xanthomonas vasicola]